MDIISCCILLYILYYKIIAIFLVVNVQLIIPHLFSFRLTEPSGYLTDGPINYKYKTKCTWLIEG